MDASTMEYAISTFLSIFKTIFTETFEMISENWFFMLLIGVPLISGIVFSVISALKRD